MATTNETRRVDRLGADYRNVGSPITNEAYNVITALQTKLEGLEAYRKFAVDGDAQLWQALAQAETQAVALLVDRLEHLVAEGKFRLVPGRRG